LKKLIIGLGLVLFFAFASISLASGDGHGGDNKKIPAATSGATIARAVKGNDSFKSHKGRAHFEPFQKGQAPRLTVIGCADSRVHSHLFGIEPDNNIFMIRNIGNQIKNSQGSVDYGVHHLPCKVLLIMGHSSCEAIKAAMGDYSGATAGIKAELDSLKPVIKLDNKEGNVNRRWAQNIEINVDYQVKQAQKLYEKQIKAGTLAVIGAVYDFNDIYGKGRGTLIITNINGDTNPNKNKHSPLLKHLSAAEAEVHVSSIAPSVEW
jgi:carbonic anhydrase